jgi:hypothetical protein
VIHIPLQPVRAATWSPRRRGEPVRIGVPLPRGAASDASALAVVGAAGQRVASHAQALDRWPDGSIRWALVDLLVDVEQGEARGYALEIAPGPIAADASPSLPRCTATEASGTIRVDTGPATFVFTPGGAFPFSDVIAGGDSVVDADGSSLEVVVEGESMRCRVARAVLVEAGPLRAEVALTGDLTGAGGSAQPLRLSATVRLMAGTPAAIVDIVVLNPRRAEHPGGHWVLGDRGSILIESMTLRM